MLKRTANLLTALLAASLLVSCGDTAKISDTDSMNTETSIDPIETADPLMDELGEYNFEGYEFRVLSAEYDPSGTFVLFDTPEETGEVLIDSLYKRNREIEERFNIRFAASEAPYGENYSTLRQTVLAGEDAYDLIMLINRNAFPATAQDPKRTSVIMEALASGSARYVFPAYYEKAVSQKVLRDEESVEMIEMIRYNRVIDLGECPWYETIRRPLVDKVIVGQTEQLASFNASVSAQVEALINETVEAAAALN